MQPGAYRSTIIWAHDTAVVGIAFCVTQLIAQDIGVVLLDPSMRWGVALVGAAALIFPILGLHKRLWSFVSIGDLSLIGGVTTALVGSWLALMMAIERSLVMPGSLAVVIWLLVVVLLTGSRLAYRRFKLASVRRRGRSADPSLRVPVLLYGSGAAAGAFLNALEEAAEPEFRVIGLLDETDERRGRYRHGVPYLGAIADLDRILLDLATSGMHPHRLVVASQAFELREEARRAIERARSRHDFEVDYAPFIPGLGALMPATGTASSGSRTPWIDSRRSFDVLASGVLLLLAAPMLLLVSAAVLIDSGRPVLFRQVRPGRDQKPFTLLKLRTMRAPLAPCGRVLADSERTSWFGRLIRRSRLDELPQLWNVFTGDMALIGPRPLLPRDLPSGEGAEIRYRVRPGITGWAQVNGGHQLTPAEKAALDAWYIRNRTLRLDLKILLLTLRTALFGERVDQQVIVRAMGALETDEIRGSNTTLRVVPLRADGISDPAAPVVAINGQERIVIVNQYYYPDVAATGQLLYSLAAALAKRGFDVGVLTAPPNYGPKECRVACPKSEVLDHVEVRRVWIPSLDKDRLLERLVGISAFLAQVFMRALLARNDRLYVYVTNPPFLGIAGGVVSLFRHHRYVILIHDAYPEVAVHLGELSPTSLVTQIWKRVNRFAFHRAESVIVLCDAARRLICENYGMPAQRVHVVHNWADGKVLRPRVKQSSTFAREHDLVAPFSLLYSGNIGLFYDFEFLLEAAEQLRIDPFRLVFVGSGGKRAWLKRQIAVRRLGNTQLHPYQPQERLPDLLVACDASLVTIARGIEGISFPSKLYSALAVGRPIVAVSERVSELRSLVEDQDVGLWAETGDATAVVSCVRRLMADESLRVGFGKNARRLFERRFTVDHAVDRYAAVLRGKGGQVPSGVSAVGLSVSQEELAVAQAGGAR